MSLQSPSVPARTSTVRVRPPAKLNLFLELLERREDGFHEIDTVMVPIDWRDLLEVRRSEDVGVRLQVDWLPSNVIASGRLAASEDEIRVPLDQDNLVCRAISQFCEVFGVTHGFDCHLFKSIPAGAGMGGASSDAAAALRAVAELSGFPQDRGELLEIATSIGSDVPFFLGLQGDALSAARATGRGEILERTELGAPLDVVVVFPNESLSTARVYRQSRVPPAPRSAEAIVRALKSGNPAQIETEMMNRLSQPAREIAPRIDEILESMWRTGLRTCQLTGSGSACFALASSPRVAKVAAASLRASLEPGAYVMATRTTVVPPPIEFC